MSFQPQSTYGYDRSAAAALASESARVFMQRVYAWMTGGLAITAGVAFAVASSTSVFAAVAPYLRMIGFGTLALVFAFSFLAHKVSGPVAAAMFIVYSAAVGLMLSTIFVVYSLPSITGAFVTTGVTFGALSAYATITKKDLSSWGTFLFIGLVGVLIASLVNLFLQSGMLSFVVSCVTVVVFAGFTAYDTQKLRQLHASSGYESSTSLAVSGALTLYLDFINIFLSLLRLFGDRR
jgi:FtsH-binding integral membrane protein